jgi:predicted TIM-barrel fold metal-dependent hydrolase
LAETTTETTTQPTTQPLIAGAVDVNVHCSRWPCRRLPLDETPALVSKLRALGVTSAWCGSFDALLHRDIAAVNARLFETCNDRAAGGMLVPFGAVNPMLPDWEEDLRRCHEVFRMPGVRLYPNYHGYTLDAPQFARLLQLATDRGLIVQVAVTMEDERVQHPLLRAAPVDVTPLPEVLKTVPAARIVLLNALHGPHDDVLTTLGKTQQVSFDIATLENVGGVASLLERVSADRVLFGSHAPFLYPQAAALKIKESALSDQVARKVLSGNADRMLKGT